MAPPSPVPSPNTGFVLGLCFLPTTLLTLSWSQLIISHKHASHQVPCSHPHSLALFRPNPLSPALPERPCYLAPQHLILHFTSNPSSKFHQNDPSDTLVCLSCLSEAYFSNNYNYSREGRKLIFKIITGCSCVFPPGVHSSCIQGSSFDKTPGWMQKVNRWE